MTRVFSIALVLALALATACGGKDKKKPQTPNSNNTPTATDNGGGNPDVNAANPSNANLGEVIYFEFDSTDLAADARNTLEQNAAWLREDASRVLTIEGHTDEVGTPAYNLGLGERRAIAAKDYLTRLGIEEKRISIITYGEEKPAGSEASLNRRSVFISTKK